MGTTTRTRRGGPVPFRYFEPAKRRATQYEEVTVHVQWAPENYAAQGWFNRDARGRGAWSDDSTELRARSWWDYRDPTQEWFRPFVTRQAAVGDAVAHAIDGALRADAFAGFTEGWKELLASHYAAYRYPEYGLFLCFSHAQREALSDVVASPLMFQGLEKDRHAQDIALYGMELENAIDGFSDASCKASWMESPIWQPTRRWVELLLAERDWGEIDLAINLVFEPLVAALFVRELILRGAPHHGDPVTPIIAGGTEADRAHRVETTAAFVGFLIEQAPENRDTIQGWIEKWAPGAVAACQAFEPLFSLPEHPPAPFAPSFARVTDEWRTQLEAIGLSVPEARTA